MQQQMKEPIWKTDREGNRDGGESAERVSASRSLLLVVLHPFLRNTSAQSAQEKWLPRKN